MIESKNLTVYRSLIPVLNDISFTVRACEFVAVDGANGAGKTTLLKCMAGAVRPDRGIVTWFGKTSRCSAAVRRQIGFAGHECGLYAELTALENLVFAARMHGLAYPAERAMVSLANADMKEIAHRPVRQMSQGMRQRLAIVRAALHDPPLILLDEPFASLDSQGRGWLEQLFNQWRHAGRTVCWVNHNSAQNLQLADRILALHAGSMLEVKTTPNRAKRLRRSA
jgi:heme exporter protein A